LQPKKRTARWEKQPPQPQRAEGAKECGEAYCPYRALVCVVGNSTQGAAALALGCWQNALSGRIFSTQETRKFSHLAVALCFYRLREKFEKILMEIL